MTLHGIGSLCVSLFKLMHLQAQLQIYFIRTDARGS